MNDVFNEVNEELKQDQLFLFFKKYGKIIIAIIILALIGFGFYHFLDSRANKAYESETQTLITILNSDAATKDNAQKIADLKTLSEEKNLKLSYLVNLFILNAYGEQNQLDQIDVQIENIINDPNAPKLYADFAALLKGMNALELNDLDQAESYLSVVLHPENPWFFSGTELMGFTYLQKNDPAKAESYFRTLLESPETPNLIRERASQALSVINSQKITG